MKSLQVLFIIRSAEHFLRYDSIISALCSAGHAMTVLFDREWSSEGDVAQVEELKKKFPDLRYHWLFNRNDRWTKVLFIARSLLTYRRYLILKDQSDFFGNRWRRYMPFWLRIPVYVPLAKTFLKTKLLGRVLRSLEHSAPPAREIVGQIRELNPDVVISPVGGIRVMSPNTEYLKAAVALGIPTASPTISWDSLTTKALITVFPDVFLLWNDFHKERAIEHHEAPRERIRLIGAPVFDKWFAGLKPSVSHREFCKQHGIDSAQPYILYLGSAAGTAENETWLIAELRKSLDNAEDHRLRELQVVVRPHPSNAKIYRNFSMPGVALVPKGKGAPEAELQLSYDTYYNAAAVVGIFTSAMMEAQIVDRPVIVILPDEYQKTQMEAQHFQDFIKGGSLELVKNFEEFQSKLQEILSGRDARKEERRKFVRRYLRPLGMDVSAGEAAVREIEKLVAEMPRSLNPKP